MRINVKLPPPKMNKTEAQFQQLLIRRPDVIWCGFEAIKFMVGVKTCWYCPDFVCVLDDGTVVVYEVKGWWKDDARVKIKAAAKQYPWLKFIAAQKKRDKWVYEKIE